MIGEGIFPYRDYVNQDSIEIIKKDMGKLKNR